MATEPYTPTLRDDGALVVVPTAPPAREYLPLRPGMRVETRRVIVHAPTAWWWDLRAVTDVYQREDGEHVVDVTTEAEWYLHKYAGRPAEIGTYVARSVYLERPTDDEVARYGTGSQH